MSPTSTSSARQHQHRSDDLNVTCAYDRCSFTSSKVNTIFHEVDDHYLKRFFCYVCGKILSSFESLRTHANSQHFQSRRFNCTTCGGVYLDPARLAKCRKRHQGMYRCNVPKCTYRNARLNSVLKHVMKEHGSTSLRDKIRFDESLGSNEPPKMRRGTVSARLSSSNSVPMAGPGDDLLFKRSEEMRREKMETIRKEHEEWAGGKDRLLALVPKYPVWVLREHPYGKMTPPSGLPSTSFQARDAVDMTSEEVPPSMMANFSSAVAIPAASIAQTSTYTHLDHHILGCDGMLSSVPSFPMPFTVDPLATAFASPWQSMTPFGQDYTALPVQSANNSPLTSDGMMDCMGGLMDLNYLSASESSPLQQYSWTEWDDNAAT